MHSASGPRVVALLLLVLSPLSLAHDFYLAPALYRVETGKAVGIALTVAHGKEITTQARKGERVGLFTWAGPRWQDLVQSVEGKEGADPAGVVIFGKPGLYVVGYESKPSTIELPAPEFEGYLREKGLDNALEARAASKTSDSPGREMYFRSAKTLIRVVDRGPDDWLPSANVGRVFGFPVEWVPLLDPTVAKPGDAISFQLLHEGAPVQGALVELVSVSDPPDPVAPDGDTPAAFAGRTDAQGRVLIAPDHAGVWRVNTVIMFSAPQGAPQDWESWWASVTFEIAPPE